MKKNVLSAVLMLFAMMVQAQNGLEKIIVEKYYISDANDTVANSDGGVLPVGSVTYRIYADMLPGYKFKAGYGVPGHELRIATTTLFFNNEDRGATTPTYNITQASHNTVLLDSWLSVGAACDGYHGIQKSEDNGVSTISNTYVPPVLQNASPSAGIPLTAEDGIILGSTTLQPVTFVGVDNDVTVFDNQNDGTNGPVFSTTNGSWASLYGSYGPDSVDNKVLIAQITTDGILSFELNIQIKSSTGVVQYFVAQNPTGNEIQIPSLTYNSLLATVSELKVPTSEFKVYPNPAENIVTMDIKSTREKSNKSYAIYDEKGSVVLSKRLGSFSDSHLEPINISSLASGEYIIELTSDGVSSAKKIIKN